MPKMGQADHTAFGVFADQPFDLCQRIMQPRPDPRAHLWRLLDFVEFGIALIEPLPIGAVMVFYGTNCEVGHGGLPSLLRDLCPSWFRNPAQGPALSQNV